MPEVFEYRHLVAKDEIDELGHANNVVFVTWMQAAAVAHSTAQGWPGERYYRLKKGWIVRSHMIEYLQPAFAGDKLVIQTWVAKLRKATSLRRYWVLRPSDQQLLAKAETNWAFIDYTTGKPTRIPAEVAHSFQVIDR